MTPWAAGGPDRGRAADLLISRTGERMADLVDADWPRSI